MSFGYGGLATIVTCGRTLVIFLALATRLALVTRDRHPNNWVEAEPLQETRKKSRYMAVGVYLLWPWANLALSTVYEQRI
ncbi:hypothetical protein BDY19DRAFT_973261 [Irpex rosettiformis]|uniref:Uncharacterized protein n=1 Tax=Irpex rosettiformis TaxID=378272 RepID=A0ACB8TQL7_9APHY|nr:hypothetical protein BDY19DRAFT_973261 [Irpex rosettiformis]